MNRIEQALTKQFECHRVVFWYDTKQELRSDFEALSIVGVEKIELANNEYRVKYQILREQPDQKFLLYHDGPQPTDLHNWLLDVQLAQGEFRTDQIAMWLAELELNLEFTDVVREHAEFYRVAKRRLALKEILQSNDTHGVIRLKMLAVCVGSEPRLDTILENLLQELSDDLDSKIKLVERCNLKSFLSEQLCRSYGYHSDEPSIRDFAIELFKSCYAMGTNGKPTLNGDALVFLKRWKDSRKFETSFEILSCQYADVLGIEDDLTKRDFRTLVDLDYFRLIDQKIISDLVKEVALCTISSGDVMLLVRQRRQGHWYEDYSHLYESIDFAAQFMQVLSEATLDMENLVDGVQRYCRLWYQLDQLYRKFTYNVRMSGQASLMGQLTEHIENLYSNNYLLKINDRFQSFVDEIAYWDAAPVLLQKHFFERCVQPFIAKDKKICVIISDAMRYEIGDELLSLIRQEDRFNAEIEPALAMLPSYTQLGMAALLPNNDLSIADNETSTVLVNGKSSQGTANRNKILNEDSGVRVTALKADDVMALKGDKCRAIVKDHDVIYIYHNRIDATGDKRETEERVFEAVEETLQELIRLIKKLTGANVNNLLLTSDHGFIYQNRAIEESDFSSAVADGKQILFRDRRFVLGKGLFDVPSLHTFTSEQLGLSGNVEVQIPKSINRLRLKGSGSRFVHGGASLQEVVIPVLKINKKRQSDVTCVGVDIIRSASTVITAGQLAVALYQTEPVTDKIQPRILRAGIYTEAGELISDSHELTFDLASSNPRERERQVRFMLSAKSDAVNGAEVILKLQEKHAGTSHYKEYKSLRYTMRRSFTSDFDF